MTSGVIGAAIALLVLHAFLIAIVLDGAFTKQNELLKLILMRLTALEEHAKQIQWRIHNIEIALQNRKSDI